MQALLKKMYGLKRHPRFVARTVLVKDNEIEDAMRILNRILGSEGWIEQWRRNRYHEPACNARKRVNYEKAKAFYDEDMGRKLRFVMKKNRENPWVGCE